MAKTERAADAAAAPATVVRSIYGQDDRIDLFRVLDRRIRNDADSVVSLFRSTMLRQEKNGDWTVLGETLGDRLNLCADQNFITQRSASFGSGVLVARDVIATAGHAILTRNDEREAVPLPDILFVFGFAMRDDVTLEPIKGGNVYRGVALIAKEHFSGGEDWALVRLDRPVKDHRIASLRRSAKMPTGTAVHIIGHPNGLPVKVASGTVTRNTAPEVFEANFDALAGNSGSPVFNSVTHEVEGIYVRGLSPWETQERGNSGCNEFRVWRVDQASEVSTRTTVFTPRLGPGWQEVDDNPKTKAIAVGAQPGPSAGPVLYQLHTNGALWRYNGTPLVGWELLDTNANTEEVATDGVDLYQRQSGNGSIWRFTGTALTGWQQVGGNPLTKQIVAGRRQLYQLQSDGLLWRYTGTPLTGWELLDRNAATTAIAADGDRLFQLHRTTGAIWQYTGTPLTGWSLLGANPLTTSILASGGQLYRLQSDGQLWRYTGTPLTGWELLDANRLTVAIAHDGLRLYQLHRTTGAVWRYTGTPLSGWQQLDDDPTTKAIHAAGRQLYQRTQRPRSGSRPALASIKRLVA